MLSFIPKLVLIQKQALDYQLAIELMQEFKAKNIEVLIYHKRIPASFKETFREEFLFNKRVLAISIWQRREFQTCKPSAHYQLPLVSGCPGLCEYCYLNTNLGRRPYIKVYVNTNDILSKAEEYIWQREPEETIFEGAATSDPVAVESWTGSLKKTVEFFSNFNNARFRFVTKYTDIGGLLDIEHRKRTQVRFSINCESVIERFERGAPKLHLRLQAASKVMGAEYPLGFLIGPIFAFEGWREEYEELLQTLKDYLPSDNITFELITHRFTTRAKKIIEEVYPETEVPLDEKTRRFKYGQFGYGKYIYDDKVMLELKDFFTERIKEIFPQSRILYFV